MTANGTPEPGFWKNTVQSPRQRLSLILWLVAMHSLFVGFGLILIPEDILSVFGFTAGGERFFRVQAGVFHFVMVVVYVMAAVRCASNPDSTYLAIAAKFIAMVFLLAYFFFAAPIWLVLFSGLGDGAFGVLIAWALYASGKTGPAAGLEQSGERRGGNLQGGSFT
jgi:hypothetical protein